MRLALLVCALHTGLSAALFTLDGEVEGIFDNREFPTAAAPSETIFGIRPTGSFGVHLTEEHSFNLGANYFFQFGQESGTGTVFPIVNYHYTTPRHAFLFGTTPRRMHLDLPTFLVSDRYDYDHPVLAGLLYQYNPGLTNLLLWVDWTGMPTDTQRESFLLGAQAAFHHPSGFLANTDFLYNHQANAANTTGNVQDYGGWKATAGWEWQQIPRIKHLSAEATSLLSFFRDRQGSDTYETPWGLEGTVRLDFNRFGLGYRYYGQLTGPDTVTLSPTSDPLYSEDQFHEIDTRFYPFGVSAKPVQISFEVQFIFLDGEMNHRELLLLNFPFSQKLGGTYDKK